MKNQIGVNLLTDNIPKDLLIGMPEEEYIRYKQQEEELENLRKIEKEHQKLNGELREEIRKLNNIINETKKILLLNFDTTTTIFNALNKLSEVDK